MHQFREGSLVRVWELRDQAGGLFIFHILRWATSNHENHLVNSAIKNNLVIIRLRDTTAPILKRPHKLLLEYGFLFWILTHLCD